MIGFNHTHYEKLITIKRYVDCIYMFKVFTRYNKLFACFVLIQVQNYKAFVFYRLLFKFHYYISIYFLFRALSRVLYADSLSYFITVIIAH